MSVCSAAAYVIKYLVCRWAGWGVGEGENGVKPLLSDFDLVIVMYTFVLYLKYKNWLEFIHLYVVEIFIN